MMETTTPSSATSAPAPSASSSVSVSGTRRGSTKSAYATALWDFDGEKLGDLSFAEGEMITVTEQSPTGWWKGYVKDRGTEVGSFPHNFVKVVHKTEPDVPVHHQGGAGGHQTTAPDGIRSVRKRRVVSFHSVERLSSLEVPVAERRLAGTELRSFYDVKATTTKRTDVAPIPKRYSEVCELDAQMRALFPGAAADESSALRAPDVMCMKKTAKVMELRRERMEQYLKALQAEPNVSMLLLTWLFPGQRIGVQEDEDVTDQSTAASGTDNELSPRGDVHSGDFGAGPHTEPPVGTIPKALVPGFEPGTPHPFSLDSCDAFDDLLEGGFAVIAGEEGDPIKRRDPPLGVGQTVRLHYTALVWDGSAASAIEYERVQPFDLRLGDFSSDTPPGLHAAVAVIPEGSDVTVVLNPEIAFGEVGSPPLVPENAQIVMHVTVASTFGTPHDGDLVELAKQYTSELSAGGSLASRTGRAQRVVIGEEVELRNGTGGGFQHTGVRRSNSQPVSLEDAEAAVRMLVAEEQARAASAAASADTESEKKGGFRGIFSRLKKGDRETKSAASSPSEASRHVLTAVPGFSTPVLASAPAPAPPVPPRPRGSMALAATHQQASCSAALGSPSGSAPSSPASPIPPPVPARKGRSSVASRRRSAAEPSVPSPSGDDRAGSPALSRSPSPSTPLSPTPSELLYSYDELVSMKEANSIPDGVNRAQLERHLHPSEFETVFKMSEAAFVSLPKWRRDRLRREAGLF